MTDEIKKSCNPFKMWGSWLGAVIVLGYFLIGIIEKTTREGFFSCMTSIGIQGSNSAQCGLFEFLVSPLMIIVYLFMTLGFLIGWGIHSLIRKYKK